MLAFGLVPAFAYVFSWISAFIGVTVCDPETVQAVGLIWVFPLAFGSSAFVPTSLGREAAPAHPMRPTSSSAALHPGGSDCVGVPQPNPIGTR